jgi:cyclic pyranopterin phosphate synthase
VGDRAVLEITQIGKECHSGCDISRQVGKCVMPKEGVFARVVEPGRVVPGDWIEILSDAEDG